MTNYVFKPARQPYLPICASDHQFPVRRIYCIGRNYGDHAIEMGADPTRESPFFFQKNPQNLDLTGEFRYPSQSNDVHFELEMVVALRSGGENISTEKALDHVFGYAPGLDMTRRDLQAEAKQLGRPWEIGKAFEGSAPIGKIMPVSRYGHLTDGPISLFVNGQCRQKGDINQMIWKVPEIISYLSRYYDIAAGDLIFSGTPAGVGAIQKGDVMEGSIASLESLHVQVV
jgi:fumarylpyruvate hydrolase